MRDNMKKKLIISLLCALFACESFAASFLDIKYNILDKPLDIPYTIGNKKMVMHTYLANKRQRTSTLRKRILLYIYDQQFKKYGIELNEAGKMKVSQLWLESCPQKDMYIKGLKSLCFAYEDVCKISLFMKKNKLTPDAAYEQYIKDNKTKLSKRTWHQLFNATSPEWREKFIKTNNADRMKLIQNFGILLPLQIRLLWEKMLAANNQDATQTVNKWKAEINALSIKVPDEYLPAKEKALKTLQNLFPPRVDLLKDKNLRPAYKELKRLTNNNDLKDSDFSSPQVSVKPKTKTGTQKLINWTGKNPPSKNNNLIQSNSKPVMEAFPVGAKNTNTIKKYEPQAGDRVIVTGVFHTSKDHMGVVRRFLIPKLEGALKYNGKWVRVIGTLSRPSQGEFFQKWGGFELKLESIEIVTSKAFKKDKIEKLSKNKDIRTLPQKIDYKYSEKDAKRKGLWKDFYKIQTKYFGKMQNIHIYAENNSSTKICFICNKGLYIFSWQKTGGNIEKVQHAKMILYDNINKITFEERNGFGRFILWHDKTEMLLVAASQ